MEPVQQLGQNTHTNGNTVIDDVNSLKSAYLVIQRDLMSLTSTIEKLVARFEESRKLNWPVIAVLAGLMPLVIGGLGFFVTSYTNSAASPIHAELMAAQATQKQLTDQVKEIATIQSGRGKDLSLMSQIGTTNSELISRLSANMRILEEKVTASGVADGNSQTDRKQINTRLEKLETQMATELADRKAQSAETRVKLSEIETQFHGVSNLENLRAAQQERLNSMLFEKAYPGTRYPNGTFFPTSIFQNNGSPSISNGQ